MEADECGRRREGTRVRCTFCSSSGFFSASKSRPGELEPDLHLNSKPPHLSLGRPSDSTPILTSTRLARFLQPQNSTTPTILTSNSRITARSQPDPKQHFLRPRRTKKYNSRPLPQYRKQVPSRLAALNQRRRNMSRKFPCIVALRHEGESGER